MSDSASAYSKRGRLRDPRLDSSPPTFEDKPLAPSQQREAGGPRIAALEASIAQLKAERQTDADDLAAMLVRVATAERSRNAAEERIGALQQTVRELEGKLADVAVRETLVPAEHPRMTAVLAELDREHVRVAELEVQVAEFRGAAAERDAARSKAEELDARVAQMGREHTEHASSLQALEAEHAEALQALEAEHAEALDAARAATRAAHAEHERAMAALRAEHDQKVQQLCAEHAASCEALRKEHAATSEVLREERASAKRQAARAVEEERSHAARARQRLAQSELALAAARETMSRAGEVLEELERREEMAGALRMRSLEQARQALVVTDAPVVPGPPTMRALPPSVAPTAKRPSDAPVITELGDMDIDLLE